MWKENTGFIHSCKFQLHSYCAQVHKTTYGRADSIVEYEYFEVEVRSIVKKRRNSYYLVFEASDRIFIQ